MVSIEAMAVVLHHSKAAGNTLAVHIGIANHEGDGGAYPKVTTLARYGRMNVRNTRKAIARLVEMGEIAVDLQAGGSGRMPDHLRPNRYVVLTRCPTWCDRSANHRDTRASASRQQHLTTEAPDRLPDDLTGVLTGGSLETGGTGVAGDRPPPVAGDRAEPSIEPHPPTPPPDARPCRDCGQSEAKCQAPQAHWPMADRHTYRPATTLHAVAHTPPTPPPPRRTRASG